MERMSVFLPADTEAGYVQAVIVADEFPIYQELGFVDSADTIAEARAKLEAATAAQAKATAAKAGKQTKPAAPAAPVTEDKTGEEDFV
jgi:hypothetical protein